MTTTLMNAAPSRRGRRAVLSAGALLPAVLFVGCTAAAPPDDEVLPSTDASQAGDDTPRNDLTDERTVDWTSYEVLSDTELRVHFVAGTPDCYGTHAIVAETAATIAITVIEGALPGAPDECALVARPASLLIRTSSPIGDRAIAMPSQP
ncbi:hypothetical protein [Leifsonia aquatica]|uniref:hypothetical protein n=1 Tax=Leifsonia aquatica TaxID=144185 RepID=UPI000ACF5EE8|nr:hypothetical protein [Leifsonia aquatica]